MAGVMRIIVVFLSTVWTLILAAPIHRGSRKLYNLSEFVAPKKQQTHLLGLTKLSADLKFWVNYSFNRHESEVHQMLVSSRSHESQDWVRSDETCYFPHLNVLNSHLISQPIITTIMHLWINADLTDTNRKSSDAYMHKNQTFCNNDLMEQSESWVRRANWQLAVNGRSLLTKMSRDTKVQNSFRDAGDGERAFPEVTLTVWRRRSCK